METIRSLTEAQLLPSGFLVTFREQNGDDDAIISTIADAQKGDSLSKFLAAIILEIDGKAAKLTPAQLDTWRTRDRISLLIKSRIFSLGPIIRFKHTCSNPDCKFTSLDSLPYEEDLSLYDWDYSRPFPEKFIDGTSNPEYKKTYIPPYSEPIKNSVVNLMLSSKKEVRYKYQDGLGEKVFLEVPRNELNKNHELLSRCLEWKDETGKFIKVTKFNVFSARDMEEIRTSIYKLDTPYDPLAEIPCPKCRNIDTVNLTHQPSFFFPQGI